MAKRTVQRRIGRRGLFYHRDSTGRHDQTPGQYVQWAATDCARHGLEFDGSPADILALIRVRGANDGDIYLDFDVQGHLLRRPGPDALLSRIETDVSVSDLYIHNRNRRARPNDPLDAVKLENGIRQQGVRIHYVDRVLEPIAMGQRTDLGETITAVIDYDASGKYREELAGKIIPAQINLAQSGYSTGGRAPFFLKRWLADSTGCPVRELSDEEVVRMPGHHVVWLPGPKDKLDLALRILRMLDRMAAARVARILTEEGIPSPDAGRTRTDDGFVHEVSGAWHANTCVNVAFSTQVLGRPIYGRRSLGDQKRYSPAGARDLTDSDFRADGKPKVVQNPESEWVIGPQRFDPPVNEEWAV